MVALPPRSGGSKTYDRAQRVIGELGGEFIPEPEAEDWAMEKAAALGVV